MQNPLTFWLLTLILCHCSLGSVEAYQSLEVRGTTMGSIRYRAVVVTDDHAAEKQNAVKNAVNSSLQRVNELMSTYLEDSDISKLNASTSTQWQSVDPDTATVVARALEICELTDGAFDPTVGPAVNAWNFGPGKKQSPKPPSDELVAEISSVVGFEKIEVRATPPSIRKLNPKVQLDLSAIAKGYAVDRVAASLTELGYENFMVEVGGEVFAKGQRQSGGPWKVGVENPAPNPLDETEDRIHRVVKLSGTAIATSGDYRNFFEVDGKRYSHTIDPKTCKPVDHGMAIASVVADDCMTADAMATAVMVMGHQKGAELCERLGYPLLTVRRSDSEDSPEHTSIASADFPLHVESEDAGTEPASEKEPDSIAESKVTQSESSSILPVFMATFLIFCLMVLGMAVGAIFNNKPVTGSCGGMANMTNEDGESVCGIFVIEEPPSEQKNGVADPQLPKGLHTRPLARPKLLLQAEQSILRGP